MKIKPYILFLLLLITNLTNAQNKDITIEKIVCITTLNDLKIEATFNRPVSTDHKFNVQIKDIDKVIWTDYITPSEIQGNKGIFVIRNLKVTPWEPINPKLYKVALYHNQNIIAEKRIGFRIFHTQNGNIYLNGKPIFLRGIAINPPDRGIPDSVEKSRTFAWDYVRYMKSIHVNIIRIPNNETWYDVCDELGMMVFGGNYSGSVDGQVPPIDYDKAVKWYKEVAYVDIASHPSLMIYAMTNEVAYSSKRGEQWDKFLSYAHKELLKWDSTRLYIANAGYGYGRTGEICDLHRYWGWYYNSPFNFINIRDNKKIIPFDKKVQPITFTECVGNYTGPSGAYNLTPNHKNPGSQLNWTGHAPWSEQPRLADEHQSFTLKTATELFRRLRPLNKELSGVFPFTIIFYNWNNVQHFTEMQPKPVTRQIKKSYQPLLVSWENYTPNVYAGNTITPTVHIINDNDDYSDLTDAMFIYELQDHAGAVFLKDSFALPEIKYYDSWKRKLSITLPNTLHTDNYTLTGSIKKGTKILSKNITQYFIDNYFYQKNISDNIKKIVLYDAKGNTAQSLSKLNIPFTTLTSINQLSKDVLFILGENSANQFIKQEAKKIQQFIANGGRMICLRQDSLLFPNINSFISYPLKNVTVPLDIPKYPPPPRPSRNGLYVNSERPQHPIFDGIKREQLRVWSDYTGWDETQPDLPAIYPVTDGYVIEKKNDIGNIAVLGNFGVALEGIAIAEIYEGKGSVLVCGMDIANRTHLDPVSDRLLLNIIQYMGDAEIPHHKYPIITDKIVWGDYASEKGVLTGINSGLLLHAIPVVPKNNTSAMILTKDGDQFLDAPGRFNTRPGVQYVPYGRRMFGPYRLRDFGNVPDPLDKSSSIGKGFFWCTTPSNKTKISTLVWNPAQEPLKITVIINDTHSTEKIIQPNGKEWVNSPIKGGDIKVTFKGDRKLVLLQTNFN